MFSTASRCAPIFLAAMALICWAATAQTGQDLPETTERGVERTRAGIGLANKGKYDRAVRLFTEIIQNRNASAVTYVNRGRAYLAQGRLRKASKDLDHALKLDSDNVLALVTRGILHRAQGKISLSFKDFTKAIELDPANINALMNRAAVYYAAGMPDRSLTDLDTIIALDPRAVRALGNRACILRQMGRYDEAIRDLTAVITLQPSNCMAMAHLGCAFEQKGDIRNAREWLRKALESEKDLGRRDLLRQVLERLSKSIVPDAR